VAAHFGAQEGAGQSEAVTCCLTLRCNITSATRPPPRGPCSRLASCQALAEEKSRLGEECARLTEVNRSLQAVLASEGDATELRNKAGEIERMIEKFKSEQVGRGWWEGGD
jgi:hypothetical protein